MVISKQFKQNLLLKFGGRKEEKFAVGRESSKNLWRKWDWK